MMVLKKPSRDELVKLVSEFADEMMNNRAYWANVSIGNKRLKVTTPRIKKWLKKRGYTTDLSTTWVFTHMLKGEMLRRGYTLVDYRKNTNGRKIRIIYIFEKV